MELPRCHRASAAAFNYCCMPLLLHRRHSTPVGRKPGQWLANSDTSPGHLLLPFSQPDPQQHRALFTPFLGAVFLASKSPLSLFASRLSLRPFSLLGCFLLPLPSHREFPGFLPRLCLPHYGLSLVTAISSGSAATVMPPRGPRCPSEADRSATNHRLLLPSLP